MEIVNDRNTIEVEIDNIEHEFVIDQTALRRSTRKKFLLVYLDDFQTTLASCNTNNKVRYHIKLFVSRARLSLVLNRLSFQFMQILNQQVMKLLHNKKNGKKPWMNFQPWKITIFVLLQPHLRTRLQLVVSGSIKLSIILMVL